jgi:hypothetical protein
LISPIHDRSFNSEEGQTVIKKILTAAMVTASMVGAGAAMAPHAMAIGDDEGTMSTSGNNAIQSFGNSSTSGAMSPQIGLVQGSLNKPCVGLPAKADVGSLVGVVPVSAQDIPVLSAPQTQQCSENSTQVKGDEPLSHVLSSIPVLSGNGEGNG